MKRMHNYLSSSGNVLIADEEKGLVFKVTREGGLIGSAEEWVKPIIDAKVLAERNPEYSSHPALKRFRPVYVSEAAGGNILVLSNPYTSYTDDQKKSNAILIMDAAGKLLYPPITGRAIAQKSAEGDQSQFVGKDFQ